MFNKKITTTALLFIIFIFQAKAQYYASALGLNGTALKTSLHNIIKNHNPLLYQDLWAAFESTDVKANGKVWDMYTDVPLGTPTYVFTFGTNQCGNYSGEGDCFNREHTWPKEYFGGDNSYPMYSDLHHLFATDGWVNNKHAAFPYGKVNNTSYTSSNGTKLGTGTTYPGYTDKIFEPIDAYKGDFARAYFYMSTRYQGEDASWQNWEMANGAQLTPAAIAILLQWHNNDPVSTKEINRNLEVYALQGNRNPFVDYPQFADCIWGTGDCTALSVIDKNIANNLTIYPNPANEILDVRCEMLDIQKINVFDMLGKTYNYQSTTPDSHHSTLNIQSLYTGNYIIKISTNKGVINKLFSKN